MKIKDLQNKKLKREDNGYKAFNQFADKLNKIQKQILFEEEYRKIKDRERRYFERKKLEEEKAQPTQPKQEGNT